MTNGPECEQTMTESSIISTTSVRYYMDGIPEKAKLLELDIGENLFLGHLKYIVDKAKRALHGLSDEDVLLILMFGDWHISCLIENGFQIKDQDGTPITLTIDLLDRIVRTDMQRIILELLSDTEFGLLRDSEENDSALFLTPTRFCAASALADAYRAHFFSPLESYWQDIVGFHALHAAEAIAMMKILDHEEYLVMPSVERAVFSHRAREGAAARLANDRDGKQAAKRQAHILWKEWKSGKHKKIRTVEQFAVEVMRRYPKLQSVNVIRRWSTEWNRELKSGGCDSAS